MILILTLFIILVIIYIVSYFFTNKFIIYINNCKKKKRVLRVRYIYLKHALIFFLGWRLFSLLILMYSIICLAIILLGISFLGFAFYLIPEYTYCGEWCYSNNIYDIIIHSMMPAQGPVAPVPPPPPPAPAPVMPPPGVGTPIYPGGIPLILFGVLFGGVPAAPLSKEEVIGTFCGFVLAFVLQEAWRAYTNPYEVTDEEVQELVDQYISWTASENKIIEDFNRFLEDFKNLKLSIISNPPRPDAARKLEVYKKAERVIENKGKAKYKWNLSIVFIDLKIYFICILFFINSNTFLIF